MNTIYAPNLHQGLSLSHDDSLSRCYSARVLPTHRKPFALSVESRSVLACLVPRSRALSLLFSTGVECYSFDIEPTEPNFASSTVLTTAQSRRAFRRRLVLGSPERLLENHSQEWCYEDTSRIVLVGLGRQSLSNASKIRYGFREFQQQGLLRGVEILIVVCSHLCGGHCSCSLLCGVTSGRTKLQDVR